MSNWAAVAGAAPPKRTLAVTTVPEGVTVVVDANAVISGIQIDRLGGTAVTTPAVLKEVKDAASRHRLATLPLGITTIQPSDDAVAAVRKFAVLTGDISTLSAVDVHLLALTWDLTRQKHGPAALRNVPCPPKVRTKLSKQKAELPGWGEDNDSWAALDAHPDTPSGQLAGSRVRMGAVVDLGTLLEEATVVDGHDAEGQLGGVENASGDVVIGVQQHDEEAHEEDDGGWETAAVSRNAHRRRRRKELRQRQQQAAVPAPGTPDRIEQPQTTAAAACCGVQEQVEAGLGSLALDESTVVTGDGPSTGTLQHAPAHPLRQADSQLERQNEVGAVEGNGHISEGEGEQTVSSSDDEMDSQAPDNEPDLDVKIVTADFAMQNVALQMGMCLATPDGVRVKQLSRWALRCTACMAVNHEHGRIFCPKCGNNALQRVQVVVHADGSETYGVRKHHVLKGTKFPLPAPRGGRNSKDPILNEDVLMQHAARIKKYAKNKEAAVDPFAPEYNIDSWLRPHRTNLVAATQQMQIAQAANMSALLASHKHNPNERSKAHRSNRRK